MSRTNQTNRNEMRKNVHNVRVNVKLGYNEMSESEINVKRALIHNYAEKVMNADDVKVFFTVEEIPDKAEKE